uniref:Uncharacterized protein n=1 Tax=Globisporangium ultimum (strain ATCC 200006 / CBS 805.95 / DAOM BR144) TaxID=431595 RepID=K3WK62_GLOUD
MEFYKAAYRSTPSTFATSVDIGALFGPSEFLDFALLREDSKLNEHIERFAPGGRYSMLGLSDFCLIDFRCVASGHDNTMKEKIAADMRRCEKFFVLCYNAGLSNVAVSNSQMRVVFSVSV